MSYAIQKFDGEAFAAAINTTSIRWDGKHRVSRRDSQRGKVYAAEREAFRDLRMNTQLGNLSVQSYQMIVDSITGSEFWAKLVARAEKKPKNVRVYFKTNPRSPATGSQILISLPPWARTIATLLHELAHSACCYDTQHHWPFAAAHLELVKHYFGQQRYEALKASYKKHKVRIKPKRAATEAQREAGRRLAAQRRDQ